MNSNGVIFPREATERLDFPFQGPPFWTPQPDQVRELESLLPSYLASFPPVGDRPVKDVFEYGRQYFGVTGHGRQVIYVNAFCEPSRFKRWQDEIVFVSDGGSCYFHVCYDPARRQFIDLHYNGRA